MGIGFHQLPRHVRDPRQEGGGVALAPGDGGQLLLPLRRQHGRGQSIRQDGDQIDPRLGGNKAFSFALHKPGRHQLLQDRRPGGRGAQPLALGVLRHLLFPGSLHRRQEGVLRVGLGRCGEVLGNSGLHLVKKLTLGEIQQGGGFRLALRLFLQGGAENAVNVLPSQGQHIAALGGEGLPAAGKVCRHRLVHIGLRNRTQQLPADQQEKVPLAHGQFGQVRFLQLQGGENGVVVGYLPIVHQKGYIREELPTPVKGRHLGRQVEDRRSGLRHIGGQIPAVRPGIGQQLLLVEGLRVVQRLFCRVAEHPVCLPLEGGQVVELGRRLFLLFTGDGSADRLRAGTGRPQGLRLLRGGDLLRHRLGPAQGKTHMVVLLLAEHCDFAVPVHQHGKGGCLDTPHIQGAVVQHRKKPCGVDPDEPVCFLAAEGGLIQRVIVRAGAQVSEALPDRRVLHGGDPQAGKGLPAACHLIDQPEDELALTPGVAGVDQFGDILPVHKAFQILEGVLLVLRQHIAEGLRQDGKVIILPLFVAGVVPGRIHRGHQMPHAPGNDEPIPFKTAIGPGCDTQGRRDGFCNTRFLADHQLHFVSSVSSSCSGSSSLIYSSSSAKS